MGSDGESRHRSDDRTCFNPRSRMGSDFISHLPFLQNPPFQSTLPHGERQTRRMIHQRREPFQSTLPHGERLAILTSCFFIVFVSIHAPAWGATSQFVIHTYLVAVSIHAPAWGATTPTPSPSPIPFVSIHAPAWGATTLFTSMPTQSWFQSTLPHGERLHILWTFNNCAGFNPRSRMGSDPQRKQYPQGVFCFNPRSRMGSDGSVKKRGQCLCRFNPRSRMGSDISEPESSRLISRFNPRSRMGSDPGKGPTARDTTGFNPRSRMGSDYAISLLPTYRSVSIHAPAWGATLKNQRTPGKGLFQSTLPHGERHGKTLRICISTGFNPRSRMGSDSGLLTATYAQNCFNPRSRMGSDHS